jgi:hypothetical protein
VAPGQLLDVFIEAAGDAGAPDPVKPAVAADAANAGKAAAPAAAPAAKP